MAHRLAERPPLTEERHPGVLDYTQRIFAAPASVRRDTDAEFGNEYFVVEVAARGSEEEVLARWHAWHRDLELPAKEYADFYRLSLLPAE